MFHFLKRFSGEKEQAPIANDEVMELMEDDVALRQKREDLRKTLGNVYERWITSVEQNDEKIDYRKLSYQPKISVIIPVYNVLDKHLIPCIESVLHQEYTNWELCMADDCSTWENVRKTLNRYASDDRIKILFREKNGHISESTNSALGLATGEFVAFMDCDDTLSPFALGEVVRLLNEDPSLDFIYSDEDKIDDDGGNRHMPHFKPDWSPDTLMSHMYTCHFGVYRKKIADEIGGLRKGFEGSQDYDFTLRFTEKTDKIAHISKILYHWREREESTAKAVSAKDYVVEAQRKCKQEALARRGLEADLGLVKWGSQYNVNYRCKTYPRVSILIQSKEPYDRLYPCVASIYKITKYPNFEVIVYGDAKKNPAGNQELAETYGVKYVDIDIKSGMAAYAQGAELAEGEYLLFLDENTEITMPDWLDRLMGQAMVPHVGAVGAKILYPDLKTIYHIGIVMAEDGPGFALRGEPDDRPYYFLRNVINYNWSAVAAECLLVSREKYDAVKGFLTGESSLYATVDFCLRLVEHGYYNVVRNDVAILYHGDIKSHVFDSIPAPDVRKLYNRHPKYEKRDPFYNDNFASDCADFSYALRRFSDVCEIEKREYKTEGILYAIDVARSVKNDYQIDGWILVRDLKDSDTWEKYVILENTDTCKRYECETQLVQRLDVKEALKQYGEFEFAGFTCMVRRGALPVGRYHIILRLKDYAADTEQTLAVGE